MIKIFLKLTCPIFITVILLISCDDSITVEDVDNRVIPDSNVSYADHIIPVLRVKCYNCHGNGRYDAGLDLSIHTRFVDGRIVVPGEPETSLLIWTVEGRPGFPEMPPIGYSLPFTENQINGFKTWIREGAKNN
ncbi:MAG: c-type cytochrome domain-containing protein [Ignavibacteriaceae bacterium]